MNSALTGLRRDTTYGVPSRGKASLGASMTISDAGWSSQVARRAHNPKVAGSNPVPATTATADFRNTENPPFCYFGPQTGAAREDDMRTQGEAH